MTALAAARQTMIDPSAGSRHGYKLADNVKVYHGGMVCLNSAGYLIPASDVQGNSPVMGVADETVDNTVAGHTLGGLTCRVRSGEAYQFVGVGLTQALVGGAVFAVDDQTIAPQSGVSHSVQVGVLVGYISSTSGVVFIPSGGVVARSSSTKATGIIPLGLATARILATNEIPALAGTPASGISAKDTVPIFERVATTTDKAIRYRWAATSVIQLQFDQVIYPPDFDNTQPVVVKVRGAMGGATDTFTPTVSYFEGVGGSDLGGTMPTLSGTALATVTKNITAVGTPGTVASVALTPGAHGTDTFLLYGAWLEYQRK